MNFTVAGDGTYTAYMKYENGEYAFQTFTITGYQYPYTVQVIGTTITVSMTEGNADKMALSSGEKNKYTDVDFTQSAIDVSAYHFTALSNSPHTVYVKVGEQEYFSIISMGTSPMIILETSTERGRNVKALTESGKIVWIAYASQNCATWTEMLQVSNGVHYIAQNETVTIPGWTDESQAYTFFFKGADGEKDYIISSSQTGITAAHENSSYVIE